MPKKEVLERIEKVVDAAREFCESCENINDTENEEYIDLKRALESAEKNGAIGCTMLKRCAKFSKDEIMKVPPSVDGYMSAWIENFKSLIAIDLWYSKKFE